MNKFKEWTQHWVSGMLVVALLISGKSVLAAETKQTVPPSRAVVFDIDGTLTPTPFRFWSVRTDAANTAHYFANQGMAIFYITARVSWLQWPLGDWLEDNHFPSGQLYLTETEADEDNHGEFKTRILQQLKTEGWQLEWAFGDSSSDFAAYHAAGIPQDRVYALKREGAEQCEPGVWQLCLYGWADFPRVESGR